MAGGGPDAFRAERGRDAAGRGRDSAEHGRDSAGRGRDSAGRGRDGAGPDAFRAGHGRDRGGRGRNGGGRLLVIGGAESHNEADDTILDRFVQLAGGSWAQLVVIATASAEPARLESEYVAVFERLGAGSVLPLRLDTRAQANSDTAVALLESATGVFFTGGDQLRIATILGGSRVDSVLHARVAAGDCILAGTSAGAAMMSSTMILGGQEAAVSTTSVRTGPGLEFLPGVLVDMHFAERGRLNRLLSAVALYPHELGLGIDENTAILVDDGRFEVIGAGSVTVIDAGPTTLIDAGRPAVALCDARLHVLPAGYAFDLTNRSPQPPEKPTDQAYDQAHDQANDQADENADDAADDPGSPE